MMKNKITICIALAIASSALSSCSLFRTDYERTDLVQPAAQWQQDCDYQSVLRDPESSWWTDFNDPQLSRIIERGMTNASQLRSALKTLQRYALQADLTDTNLYPTLNAATISASKSWNNDTWASKESSSASLSVSYEIDLFGRLKAERDVSRFAYEASEWDYKSVKLSLAASIAKQYWQIGYYNDALRYEVQNNQDLEKILEKVSIRHSEGAISSYELNRTREQLLSSKNNIISYKNSLADATGKLMILLSLDEVPSDLKLSEITLQNKKVPVINPGIPADLLENRPDLQSAEHNLMSLLANYDKNKLNLFPRLSLTGSESTSSADVFKFFTNPVSSISGALSFPFLNYNVLSLNRDIAKIDYEKAVIEYENKVRTALYDVWILTQKFDTYAERVDNAHTKVQLAESDDRNYDVKYDNGAMSYNDYLNNKLQLRSSVLSYYKELQSQLECAAELYNALGGSQKVVVLETTASNLEIAD